VLSKLFYLIDLNSPFSKMTHRQWLLDSIYLAIAFLVFYTFWLGGYPLFTPDEGRYSEIAREMIATGDYITPRVNGVVFLDKPILHYWLQVIAIQLFGVKEWALRLFPALIGVSGCMVMYSCGRYLFDRRTGILAAIILATTPLYFGVAHYANLDMEIAVFISSALLFFLCAVQPQDHHSFRPVFFYIACFFVALACLTKGMMGLVLPLLIAGTWIIIMPRWDILTKHYWHVIAGLLLIIALVMPWYVLVQQANPQFLHYFFVTQQVTRFLSAGTFNNQMPVWFYFPIILIGFIPWTVFLLQTIKITFSHCWRDHKKHATELFLLLWAVIILIFFSIPHSKLLGYIVPVFPPLALLVGHYLSKKYHKKILISCVSASVILLFALVLNATRFNHNSAKPLVQTLQTIMNPQAEVITYFKYYQDVPLYLAKRVTVVANWQDPSIVERDNWRRELWIGRTFQNTDDWLIDEDTFWQRFQSNQRVFVFLNVNYLDQFKLRATSYFILDTHNNIILLSNQPNVN